MVGPPTLPRSSSPRCGSGRVADVADEVRHVGAEGLYPPLTFGLEVEADVGEGRAPPHVDRALEVRAHERADGVAVPPRLTRALRPEERHRTGKLHVLAPGALHA